MIENKSTLQYLSILKCHFPSLALLLPRALPFDLIPTMMMTPLFWLCNAVNQLSFIYPSSPHSHCATGNRIHFSSSLKCRQQLR